MKIPSEWKIRKVEGETKGESGKDRERMKKSEEEKEYRWD